MRPPIRPRAAAFALVSVMACLSATAQGMGQLFVRPDAEFYFPLNSYQGSPLYSTFGMGGGSILDFTITPWLAPFVRGQYTSIPYAAGGASLQSAEGDLGLGFTLMPADKLYLRLEGMGGLAQLFSTAGSGAAFSAGGRLDVEYRFAPSWTISATGGYSTLFGTQAPILSAVEAGINFSYDLSALAGFKPRLSVEDVKLDAVFPSLYAYYDDNAFGTVKVVNREDASIRDVSVTFDSSRYMDQPKVCGKFDLIPKGGSATVSIKALFTDSVLDITQNIDAKGEIVVEYSYLGSDRVVRTPVDFQMHHRNAITWSDDRRAAAFVSPTNPAAMWFSKFAAGIARDRLRGDINKPLQYAIAMFEAERAYGLNYVVVPANDYSVKHGLKGYIDSVQFPHQTLSNRGGDCSDLAILFTTLMQSVGVESAFITIPGHIFAAFDTGLDEADAREDFYDPGLFILRDGEAWIPVEITMVNDGFIKAWRVAAKEWSDNSRKDLAAFYRLPDCWKVYPSAAFPNVDPRFALPDQARVAAAFDSAVDRFAAREVEPEVRSLEAELANADPDVRGNRLGILFARYGMFGQAWARLVGPAKDGYQKAWTNLGNLAYIRKDFKLALSYYQWAYKLDGSDDGALLGIARCQYELEDFDASDAAYAELESRDPDLAGRFGYLGSVLGGPGRAWSLADRFESTSWAASQGTEAEVPAPAAVADTSTPPSPVLADGPTAAPAIAAVLPRDADLALAGAEVEADGTEVAAAPPPGPSPVPAPVPVPVPAPVPAAVQPQPAQVAAAASQPPQEPSPAPSTAEAPAIARAEEANPPVAFQPAVAPASDETAAPAPPVTKLLIDGFGSAVPVMGEWKISGGVAMQTDPDAFFAKLETPLVQDRRTFSYSFSAKSDASRKGWVGIGFHAFTPKSYTQKGYGSGDSLLVWLTRDPVHFKKDVTRLQLYRSTDDWNMSLLDEVPVTESIYDLNRFDITVDPVAGTVSISMNGTERLVAKGILDLRDGIYVVFRSLDTAEFSDFKAEEVGVPAEAPVVAASASVPETPASAAPAAPQATTPSIGAVPVPQPEAPQPAEVAIATNPPSQEPSPAAVEPAEGITSTGAAEANPPSATQPESAPPVPATPAASAPAQPETQTVAASPVKELRLEGFGSAVPIVGQWKVSGGVAIQTDPDAFFAKLATPLVQDKRTISYSFSAKSDARGRGWVGVGFHAFTPKSYTQKGFGSGDSLCVWLTRDPVHFTKDITRLQLYRSTDDWNMTLVDEVPVTESIYDSNRFDVTVDPVAGTVSVSMNGTERLVAKGILDLREGIYVVFRSLDTAEFSDFKAEVSK